MFLTILRALGCLFAVVPGGILAGVAPPYEQMPSGRWLRDTGNGTLEVELQVIQPGGGSYHNVQLTGVWFKGQAVPLPRGKTAIDAVGMRYDQPPLNRFLGTMPAGWPMGVNQDGSLRFGGCQIHRVVGEDYLYENGVVKWKTGAQAETDAKKREEERKRQEEAALKAIEEARKKASEKTEAERQKYDEERGKADAQVKRQAEEHAKAVGGAPIRLIGCPTAEHGVIGGDAPECRSTDLSDAFVETARKCRSTWVIPAGTSYIHSCNGSEERSHLAGLFAKIAGAPGKCICTFDSITVQGSLKIENEETTNITYRTRMMLIDGGEFIAGESEQDPFKGKLELVLTGKSADQDDSKLEKAVLDCHGNPLVYSKMLLNGWRQPKVDCGCAECQAKKAFGTPVDEGGQNPGVVKLHGLPKTSWTKLAATVERGATNVHTHTAFHGWKEGDEVLLPTTNLANMDNTYEKGNEIRVLANVADTSLTLSSPLKNTHDASYADDQSDVPADALQLRGEIANMSRNIVLRGDNTDSEHAECLNRLQGDRGFANKAAIREHCYGAHTATLEGSTWQVSNVELKRVGQATRIARYPFHWHLAGEDTQGNYIKGAVVRDSYQRCVTTHGTWGISVEDMVCFNIHGHAFYLEDGIEHANTYKNNLIVQVKPGAMICFWITNPDNSWYNNLVVDAPLGYWLATPNNPEQPGRSGWSNGVYWTEGFTGEHGGAVMNPSKQYFSKEKRPLVPKWILQQRQARTPFRKFQGNGARSVRRALHFDASIYSSTPGEYTRDGHLRGHGGFGEKLYVFTETEGPNSDGTCVGGNIAGEGVSGYYPMSFQYDELTGLPDPATYSQAQPLMENLHVGYGARRG